MTAYEDAKEELENQLPEYIERVGEFQHENQRWRITDYYKLKHSYAKCMVCGKPNIIHVFVVENVETENKITVGNVCIDKISNSEIAEWYHNVKDKIETLEKNKAFINVAFHILQLHRQGRLPIIISPIGIKRLQKMYDRASKGWAPLKSQRKLLRYYAKKLWKETGYKT